MISALMYTVDNGETNESVKKLEPEDTNTVLTFVVSDSGYVYTHPDQPALFPKLKLYQQNSHSSESS